MLQRLINFIETLFNIITNREETVYIFGKISDTVEVPAITEEMECC